MKVSRIKSLIITLSVVAISAMTAAPASAILISSELGSWDGTEQTQTGRINRDTIVSDGTGNKTFPGVFSESDTFFFETFQFFNTGVQGVVTIDAVVDHPNTHFSVFSGTTYDTLFSNNAGNYLGDIGSSESQTFSILAPANSAFLVVASTNFVGDTAGTFSFTVEGDSITNVAVTAPETLALLGLSLVGLVWSRRKKI